MNFIKKHKSTLLFLSKILIFAPIIVFTSCIDSEPEKSDQHKIGYINAIRLKNFLKSNTLTNLSVENKEKIYQNQQAKFYLINFDSLSEPQVKNDITPEYQTNFNPFSDVSYISLINRYYNTKQFQNIKRDKLKQNINSIYVPGVSEKSLNFWYLYVMPISIGFSEIKINGKKENLPPAIPKKLTPYNSVEIKLLKKGIVHNDGKNYIQIDVNQMLNSFAYKIENPDCKECSDKVSFGFLDSEKYPNYKLYFNSLDLKNKIIKFKTYKKNDNLNTEKTTTNSLNSNVSTLNFLYKTKNYQLNSNPDNYFEKNTEKIDKNIDFPFVRFYTTTFIVPFEDSENNFGENFKIEIENN